MKNRTMRKGASIKLLFVCSVVLANLLVSSCKLANKCQVDPTNNENGSTNNTLTLVAAYLRSFPCDAYLPSQNFRVLGKICSSNILYFANGNGVWQLNRSDLDVRGNSLFFDLGNQIKGEMVISDTSNLQENLSKIFKCGFSFREILKLDNIQIQSDIFMVRLVTLSNAYGEVRIAEQRYFYDRKKLNPVNADSVQLVLWFPLDASLEMISKCINQHYPNYLNICEVIQKQKIQNALGVE
jgi:hypothetical protein